MMDVPLERVGCKKKKKKSDRKWLIYNPTLRIAKHSLNCVVKVLSISFSLIFASVEGSKYDKMSREEQSRYYVLY